MKATTKGLIALACLAALAGCMAPMPALSDFTDDKAEVEVPFDMFGSPSLEDAKIAADPVGEEHCDSLGKDTTYISARRRSFGDGGIYMFLYRCEGADRVVVE